MPRRRRRDQPSTTAGIEVQLGDHGLWIETHGATASHTAYISARDVRALAAAAAAVRLRLFAKLAAEVDQGENAAEQ